MSYNPYSKPLNERDTHFQGFAKLFMRDVDEKNAVKGLSTGRYLDEEELCLIIAQRSYDLAEYILIHHTFLTTGATTLETAKMRVVNGEAIKHIPDFTEWPERS